MNPETGQIYRTPEEAKAARDRGEPLVEVSERVANLIEDGHRYQQKQARKRVRKAARAARKRNR